MAIVEVSVIPIGTQTPSVSRYVARAVRVLQSENSTVWIKLAKAWVFIIESMFYRCLLSGAAALVLLALIL